MADVLIDDTTGAAHTCDSYAEHIMNYAYTYKDDAGKTVQVGPMAQDIQQVNPACVIVDPKDGHLAVDTGRLALMNAGTIAELARRLHALEELVNTLGGE